MSTNNTPYYTPNSTYLRYSNIADKQINILGNNAKYALYNTDQDLLRGTRINPSIPSMNQPNPYLNNSAR